MPDPLQKGGTATDSGVNTDADWENQVAATFNHNSILNEQYEGLMKKQQEENEKCNKDIQELLNKQEAAKQQHKARLFPELFRTGTTWTQRIS